MIRFLLIRHGNTDLLHRALCGRTPGVSLNEEGRRQARVLGRELASIRDLKAVYASPLERTQETAAFVAEPHGLKVKVVPDLIEIDFGEWTGLPFSEIQASGNAERDEQWSAFNRYRSMAQPPGGETMVAVQSRAWGAVMRILQRHEEGCVALVSHGDVIRALLLYVLGMPLDHIFRIEVEPGSVSEISVGIGRAPVVHAINRQWSEATGAMERDSGA